MVRLSSPRIEALNPDIFNTMNPYCYISSTSTIGYHPTPFSIQKVERGRFLEAVSIVEILKDKRYLIPFHQSSILKVDRKCEYIRPWFFQHIGIEQRASNDTQKGIYASVN
jgi:hypothetical protein